MAAPLLTTDGPDGSALTVALAHGAGQPMDSRFMQTITCGLAAVGWRVVRFEFPYMARRRTDGSRRPPDREPVLLETWRAVIDAAGPAARLVIGGKSMGGRMASLLADAAGVAGLVCLGYPFHPAARQPEPRRIDHLATMRTPTLVVQGERDAMGSRASTADVVLSSQMTVTWLPDGDHSFVPRKASGVTEADNLAAAIAAVDGFLRRLAR